MSYLYTWSIGRTHIEASERQPLYYFPTRCTTVQGTYHFVMSHASSSSFFFKTLFRFSSDVMRILLIAWRSLVAPDFPALLDSVCVFWHDS